jgi:hypothetical protein
MIKPNSLLALLKHLVKQKYDIDHINVNPILMPKIQVLFQRIKAYEVRFFKDYVIIYIDTKPIVIKSYGWMRAHGSYEPILIDPITKSMYTQMIIKYNENGSL